MPTVHREDGFEIRIYLPPREHTPPHVHVLKAGGEVVIELGDNDTSPQIREVHGMTNRDALKAYRIVDREQENLLEAWSKHHA